MREQSDKYLLIQLILDLRYPSQKPEDLMSRQTLRNELEGKTFGELEKIRDHPEDDSE